jgi:hypothetical protein
MPLTRCLQSIHPRAFPVLRRAIPRYGVYVLGGQEQIKIAPAYIPKSTSSAPTASARSDAVLGVCDPTNTLKMPKSMATLMAAVSVSLL